MYPVGTENIMRNLVASFASGVFKTSFSGRFIVYFLSVRLPLYGYWILPLTINIYFGFSILPTIFDFFQSWNFALSKVEEKQLEHNQSEEL